MILHSLWRALAGHSTPALLAVLLALPAHPAVAQTEAGGPDIFAIPDPAAPDAAAPDTATPSGSAGLGVDHDAKTARAFLEAELARYRSAGLIMPRIEDIGDFDDATVLQLQDQLLADPRHICEQSVRTALFLDAHLEEADWRQVAIGVERLPELALDTLLVWLPDEHDVFQLLVPELKALDKVINNAMDLDKTAAILKDHYVPSPAVRNGQWVNEIVSTSMAESWPEDRIEARRADLLAEGQKAAENMIVLQKRIDEALHMVDERLQGELAIAWGKRNAELRGIADKMGYPPGVSPEFVLPPQTVEAVDLRYGKTVYDLKKAVTAENDEKIKWAYRAMTEAQLAAEKALVQRDALARYSSPIARGACHEITRNGPVVKAAKKPTDTVLELPHDQLLSVLDAIGSRPSLEFLGCLCQNAGYGSSGTGQFYHPDTLGTYDRRYSCQHPGDPCIVQGYGCLRHPLPSDPEIWALCSATTGEPVDKAIDQAIKARKPPVAASP